MWCTICEKFLYSNWHDERKNGGQAKRLGLYQHGGRKEGWEEGDKEAKVDNQGHERVDEAWLGRGLEWK